VWGEHRNLESAVVKKKGWERTKIIIKNSVGERSEYVQNTGPDMFELESSSALTSRREPDIILQPFIYRPENNLFTMGLSQIFIYTQLLQCLLASSSS
jgi:hypothetical protein